MPQNPNAYAAAQALLVQAKKLMESIAVSFLALGDVLNALLLKDFYRELADYTSFREFLKKEGLIPHSTARRYMLLAETYPSPDSRKMGVEKAVALLRLAESQGENPDELAANDAVIDGRPVSEHDASSLNALRLANERRREQLEADRAALASDPKLADQHKSARSTARKLETALESSFALPDTTVRAVKSAYNRSLMIRIDLNESDALELLELVRAYKEDEA